MLLAAAAAAANTQGPPGDTGAAAPTSQKQPDAGAEQDGHDPQPRPPGPGDVGGRRTEGVTESAPAPTKPTGPAAEPAADEVPEPDAGADLPVGSRVA